MINTDHIAQDLATAQGAPKINAVSATRQVLSAGVLVGVDDPKAAAAKLVEFDAAHVEALSDVAAEAQTQSDTLLIEAKKRLRAELADPKYAKKTPDEIRAILSTEVVPMRDKTKQELAQEAIAQFVAGPAGLWWLDQDGKFVDEPVLQKAIDAKIQAGGQVALSATDPPPIMRIFAGLSYAMNTVTDGDIAEAMA